ncbi:MAG: tRNA 2-thiouridine(34) synthase MnmA [Acidimicrobiales bacterium]|nr:tRNA 2-thiouridine(34) synthase MnmA [Acidimicrobiales bacterium]
MRVLVAMSGGVDSSVAAALLVDQLGAEAVVGATLKLWGGESDSGCCSVADTDDARRVADQLGIVHHVFNFSGDFERTVVGPYVRGHGEGTTPNPCVECNRHIKFDRLFRRALDLGFDAVATGHHARVRSGPSGRWELRRGADRDKDQSYVVAMLDQAQLERTRFPVGHLTKSDVRAVAAQRRLRTAAKPDSQDVCFIRRDEGRDRFLGDRLVLHEGRLVDGRSGDDLGAVQNVELVTVGQRRGMGHGADGRRRYVTSVDVPGRRVVVGPPEDAVVDVVDLGRLAWVDDPMTEGPAVAQCSAHGRPVPCRVQGRGDNRLVVVFAEPERRVAPGQTVALYAADDPDRVVGSGIAR